MDDEIQYRVLGADCMLRRCLHDGPIPLEQTSPDSSTALQAESEAGVPPGSIDAFLKALCQQYGAYGIAAVHGDMVIGQVRFFPSALADKYTTTAEGTKLSTCIQEHHQIQAMADIDLQSLPRKADLSPKALTILCFQLVNDYKAMAEGKPTDQPSYLHRGIGTALLEKSIDWARSEGWDEIHATAIPHSPPLMTWSSALSVKRYSKFGFRILPSTNTSDGPVSQRRGYHGEAMKRMWEPYAHLSDEEVSKLYDVVLELS